MVENSNPLSKYYRQPAVYITLPSKGRYYGADVYEPTVSGEIPVLPMTAKDELTFKTPDAMLSGQATVDVIQSCVPNIKNAWKLTNYDLDTVLLGIRIASYGENMDIETTVPVINERINYSVNLPSLLESIKNVRIRDEATTSQGFTIKIKPLLYADLTRSQIATFEQQKMFAAVNMSGIDDQEKNKRFAESFRRLTEINFEMLLDAILEIKTPDGAVVHDKKQIQDFVENAGGKVINEIQDKLTELRTQAQIKPITIKSTEEQIKRGVPVTYEVPVTFDNSNFFV